jgi:hypothetical protein
MTSLLQQSTSVYLVFFSTTCSLISSSHESEISPLLQRFDSLSDILSPIAHHLIFFFLELLLDPSNQTFFKFEYTVPTNPAASWIQQFHTLAKASAITKEE